MTLPIRPHPALWNDGCKARALTWMVYGPLITCRLRDWDPHFLTLTLDTSDLSDHSCLIRAAALWRGRAGAASWREQRRWRRHAARLIRIAIRFLDMWEETPYTSIFRNPSSLLRSSASPAVRSSPRFRREGIEVRIRRQSPQGAANPALPGRRKTAQVDPLEILSGLPAGHLAVIDPERVAARL